MRTDVRVIAERLKREREALGLSQQAMADRIGVSLRSQQNYEKGDRSPDATYLSSLASAGADVMFILTGQRSGVPSTTLTPDELVHVTCMRGAPPELRKAALRVLLSDGDDAVKPQVKKERVVSTAGGIAAGRDVKLGGFEQGVKGAKSRSEKGNRSRS